LVHEVPGLWEGIVAGRATPPSAVDRAVTLWRAALVVALAPYPLSVLLPQVFFLVAPLAQGLALALGIAAYAVGRRLDFGLAPFAVVLFTITTALTAYASVAWLMTPTCGGGLSGPCFSPFVLCGLGLISAVVATILVVVGNARLRRATQAPRASAPIVRPGEVASTRARSMDADRMHICCDEGDFPLR